VCCAAGRRVEEPRAQRQEELLQASDRAGRVAESAQEAAGGQEQEEELHPRARRVAQLARQAAGQYQQSRLHDPA